MVGDGARVLVRSRAGGGGLDRSEGALPRFLEIYDTRLLDHTRPYDGIAEALARRPRAALA